MILSKSKSLICLDVSSCTNLKGLCFFDVPQFAAEKLSKLIISFTGYEMQRIKAKVELQYKEC
jgi:hypothetical protein